MPIALTRQKIHVWMLSCGLHWHVSFDPLSAMDSISILTIWCILHTKNGSIWEQQASFNLIWLDCLPLPPLVSEDQAKFVSNESKPSLWKQSDILSFLHPHSGLYLRHTSSLSLSLFLPDEADLMKPFNSDCICWILICSNDESKPLRPKISFGVPICLCLCVCIRFCLCNTYTEKS